MLAISSFTKGRKRSNRYPRHGKNGYRVGVAHADYDRPFDKGDILGDFAWRRTHVAPVPNKAVERIIKGYASCFGVEITRVAYSRYAGCSCPCSPGYIIYGRIKERIPYTSKFNFSIYGDELNVWLKPVEKIYSDRRAMELSRIAREHEKIAAIQGAGI